MTNGTNRRTFLGTVATVTVLAGCLGDINEGNEEDRSDDDATEATPDDSDDAETVDEVEEADTGDGEETRESDEETEGPDPEQTGGEFVDLVRSRLEEEGIETQSVERRADVLEVVYYATGMTSEAVTSEIDVFAGVYARAIEEGLTTDRLEAFVLDPDDETLLDSFVIETEWAEAVSNDEISQEEYVERIVGTFESDSTAE